MSSIRQCWKYPYPYPYPYACAGCCLKVFEKHPDNLPCLEFWYLNLNIALISSWILLCMFCIHIHILNFSFSRNHCQYLITIIETYLKICIAHYILDKKFQIRAQKNYNLHRNKILILETSSQYFFLLWFEIFYPECNVLYRFSDTFP